MTRIIDEIECSALPSGEYGVGVLCPDRFAGATERPTKTVALRRSVYLACDPVTEQEFARFVDDYPVEATDLPAVMVSWHDAVAYCDWLSQRTGHAWRLPSEAEWEIGCRAGTTTVFHTGDTLSLTAANYYYNESGERIGAGRRLSVGSRQPNAWGLRDMHGNLAEWCSDAWAPSHDDLPLDGSPRTGSAEAPRVIRGGSWDLLPRLLRSSSRDALPPETRRDNLGFRLAVTLED